MKILISNDDGIQAPGLARLAHALSQVADITVVAPDRDRSGASNSLTLANPIRAHTLENGWISIQGTPTDCVHLALTGLIPDTFDMVVSGINAGANMGDNVLYSGTVAASIEGRFLGYPAMAVSLNILPGQKIHHYDTAAEVAKDLVGRLKNEPLPTGTILNINVPNLPYDRLKGYSITRLGTQHRSEITIRDYDPRGREMFWIGPSGKAKDQAMGTDFFALSESKVSITPLQLDLTHYKMFEQVSTWIKDL